MRCLVEPKFTLRYNRYGVESMKNLISPMIVSEDVTDEDVPECIRYQYQIVRTAVGISRKRHYDMDIYLEMNVVELVIYMKFSEPYGLYPLLELFSKADFVDMSNHKSGKSVMFTAIYLDRSGRQGK